MTIESTTAETVALRSHATAPVAGDTAPEFWPATAPLLSVRRTSDGRLLPDVDARRVAARMRRLPGGGTQLPSIAPGADLQVARATCRSAREIGAGLSPAALD